MSETERVTAPSLPGGDPPLGVAERDAARLRRRALGIAGGYLVLGGLWILFSDRILEWIVTDPGTRSDLGTAKGWGFVLVTAVLLWLLIRGAFEQIAGSYVALDENDRQLQRLGRLHTAMVEVHQAIIRRPDRDELFTAICHALVESGGFAGAWIEWTAQEHGRPTIVACAGMAPDDDRAGVAGWGPGCAVFPLRVGGAERGVLGVRVRDPGILDDAEIALLDEAASDVSFALENLDREAARAAVEQVAREERRFSGTMIDSMPGVVYFYDITGRFLRWNQNFADATGYTHDEIRDMNPLDFFTDDDRTLVAERIGKVFETGEASVEAPLRRKDGTIVPYFFTGRRVAFDGRTCLVGVGIDITTRVRAEHALQELNENLEQIVVERTAELQDALVRAEAADRIKSAFLATMSHELRTPLNSIIGFTGIILQELAGPLNEEQAKQLGMVQTSARHLLALINDVLDISKIEAGQLDVHAEPFDLRSSVERVVGTMRPLAEAKGLGLHITMAADVGEVVADERRVEQILLNLLSNAVKFTETGHVALDVAGFSDPTPDPAHPWPSVRICVRDTGIGIRSDDLDLLFQPFRQVDSGLSRQHDGTGLGLAICRRLLELMGGRISVWSRPGEGTEFAVVLPLRPRAAAPATPPSAPPVGVAP